MRQKLAIVVALITFALFAVGNASAQEPPRNPPPQNGPQQPRPPMDPLADVMFPPEMIMGHTRELALTDEQKTFMRAEIQKTTARFNDLQWQVQDAMEALHGLMKASPVNEQQALAQLDKVLDGEREIKRLHFSLAIALKNKLTPDQASKLGEIMKMERGGPRNGPGVPGGRGPGPGGRPPRPEGQNPGEPPPIP